MVLNRGLYWILGLLVISALVVVTVRHQNRLAFVELQSLEEARDQLQVEWGRLMLERARLSVEYNIADQAGDELKMAPPVPGEIITVELSGVN